MLSSTQASNAQLIIITIVLVLQLLSICLIKKHQAPHKIITATYVATIFFAIVNVAITFYQVINWPHEFTNIFNFVFGIIILILTFYNSKYDISHY